MFKFGKKKSNSVETATTNVTLDTIDQTIDFYTQAKPLTRHYTMYYSDPEEFEPETEKETEIIDYKNAVVNLNTCHMCFSNQKTGLIILNCGHTFHIKCLSNESMTSLKDNNGIIDHFFLNHQKCLKCNTKMESSEIMFIHNKNLTDLNDSLSKNQMLLAKLEDQMNQLKANINKALVNKHQLENEKQSSRQIVNVLSSHL